MTDDVVSSGETGSAAIGGPRRWHVRIYRLSFSFRPTRGSAALGAALVAALLANSIGLGWLFMLLAGALFSEFGLLQPIGFWPALGIAMSVWGIISLLGHSIHLRE